MNHIYPLKLSGIAKETIWGGNKIHEIFHTDCGSKTGELWVLSAREKEDCKILNGQFKGMTFTEYLSRFMPDLLPFPLLIKFIDANDRLSVQVHPDDEVAANLGSGAHGKTEMWHIINADEGASIVYGTKNKINKEDIKKAIKNDNVEDILNYIPVKAGETYFIPAGLVHAIGKGILLAEVQQNSDTTYRFYDYGRIDANGNPRELHIEKALAATKDYDTDTLATFVTSENDKQKSTELISECEYFKVFRKNISGNYTLKMSSTRFCSILCLAGNALISYSENTESISVGDSFFIPHGLDDITLSGNATFLISVVKGNIFIE